MAAKSVGSVTQLLIQLKDGDLDAAEPICRRYLGDLVRVARGRLQNVSGANEEAEDVVQDALGNFFNGLGAARFRQLDDRSDLWQVLVLLTKRRAIDAYRKQRRQAARSESELASAGAESGGVLANVSDAADSFGAEAASTLSDLLDLLPDTTLAAVATGRLDGYTNSELAEQLDVSERTIERKLQLIRDIWKKSMA
jgi:RNA polymerase sigma factor (sigma-70 family)